MKFKNLTLIICIVWLALISGSFYWNYANLKKESVNTALFTARSFFNMVLMSREWNARHTVYIIATDDSKPNKYLKMDNRDIVLDDGTVLTMMNPAYMTREISEISYEKEGIRFHITSLNPIRPDNKATETEKKALKKFEDGVEETGFFIRDGKDKGKFFYMAPLETNSSCLKCHGEQGYEVGDIRGGISVTMPFTVKVPPTLLAGHSAIGFIGLFGIIISGRKLETAYKEMKRQAMHDTLTEIPNRQAFNIYLEKELKRSLREKESLSLIMCDIDKFKPYNDHYGHIRGDECLKIVAHALVDSLNRPADFCARFGGEEFVVVLPNTKSSGALHLAESIRKSIEDKAIEHRYSDVSDKVTASFGVTTLEPEDQPVTPEALMKTADDALYDAKDAGRNCVRFIAFGQKCDS